MLSDTQRVPAEGVAPTAPDVVAISGIVVLQHAGRGGTSLQFLEYVRGVAARTSCG
jgi:hypothetical protein